MGAEESKPVLCGIPGCTRPCHDDGRVVHEYCGRTHAKQAASSGLVAGDRRSQTGTICQVRLLQEILRVRVHGLRVRDNMLVGIGLEPMTHGLRVRVCVQFLGMPKMLNMVLLA